MAAEQRFKLTITREEASTLLIALSEYLYLAEEGDIGAVLEELDHDDEDDELLDAAGASALAARIEALLS
jgi:hypothetical protein